MNGELLQTIPLHSLYKLFPETEPSDGFRDHFSALQNEPLSFQVAYRLRRDAAAMKLPVYVRVETDLPVALYHVGFVPVAHTETEGLADRYRPGLFPDPLFPKAVNPPLRKLAPFPMLVEDGERTTLHAARDCYRAVWLTVGGKKTVMPAGDHTVTVVFFSAEDGSEVGRASVTVRVVPAMLPKEKLIYTNWVHCDCIADMHGVPVFSDRFFEIFAHYIRLAAKNGMNTLLTPCFTPPLDTPIGEERMTVQLVGVTVADGGYHFDFSLLDRFISVARRCGIRYFEHAHLFTQWGATCAPKIVARVRGREKTIFGWHTPVAEGKYEKFLRAYIPALLAHLREQGLDRQFLFHISDEPSSEHMEAYRRARAALGDMLKGYTVMDAVFNYEPYAIGLVETPIAVTSGAAEYRGRCPRFFCYYTGGQCEKGMSNRFVVASAERNRMLGVQMYAMGADGFLQWAYNYYYDFLSQGLFYPLTEPDGYLGRGPGTSYMVYPLPNGEVLESIRQKVFCEGLNDHRALCRLAQLRGKRFVSALLREWYGEVDFYTPAGSAAKLLAFRDRVNDLIAESVTA